MYGIKLMVRGDYALFSRPELKVERVSYDVPTPSALEGLLRSVYWHPGVRYRIDRIHVLKPIRFVNIRRNEVKDKLLPSDVKRQMEGKADDISLYTKECISQRASLLLKDVCYGVEAHFEFSDGVDAEMTEDKFFAILTRRLKKGQFYSAPFFGCREFSAQIEWTETFPESEIETEDVDLGYMLYDLQYQKTKDGKPSDAADPRFYRPHMKRGVIDVAEYAKELLC